MDKRHALMVAAKLAWDQSSERTWELLGKEIRQEITPRERGELRALEGMRVALVVYMDYAKEVTHG